MTSEGTLELAPIASLYKEGNNIVDLIISEKDPVKLENLTNLFKQNQLKKNLIRSNKLSSLLEIIDDEVISRVTTSPEAISNKDLINYMNTTQQAVQVSTNNYEQLPTIQINNIENNVSVGTNLTAESRKVVLNKVQEILNTIKSENIIDIGENKDA